MDFYRIRMQNIPSLKYQLIFSGNTDHSLCTERGRIKQRGGGGLRWSLSRGLKYPEKGEKSRIHDEKTNISALRMRIFSLV